MPGMVKFWGPYTYRSAFHATDDAEECERALAHLADVIMVEGAHTIAAIVLETVVGTNGILVPPGRLPRRRARAVRRARHRDDRRRGDGRLRPLRRVVRRRPLGRHARPHLLRQGRQLGLRAARRRRHQPTHRRHVRRPPVPRRPHLLRPPARLRRRPWPASTSSRTRASSSTPATSAPTSIGPALAEIADTPPDRRRGARPRRVLGDRAGARPGDPRAARAVQRRRDPTPRRWPSSPPRASSAACGRSPTSTACTSCRRSTISDDDMREGLAIIDEALAVADRPRHLLTIRASSYRSARARPSVERPPSCADTRVRSTLGRERSGRAAIEWPRWHSGTATPVPASPTAGRTCSRRVRRSGGCSRKPTGPASASWPTGSCAPSASRPPAASSSPTRCAPCSPAHACLLILGLDESCVRRRRHHHRAFGLDDPARRQRRPDQWHRQWRADGRRRRGPPRRRSGDGVVVVGTDAKPVRCATAATSCCTRWPTSSTCSTASLDGTPHLAGDDDIDRWVEVLHAPTTTSCARAPPGGSA